MREQLLRSIIYFTGFLALTAFIIVRFTEFPDALKVKDLLRYGDLYRMNYIAHFNELIPKSTGTYSSSSKQAAINDADILIFGDSFLDHDKGRNIPEMISDSLLLKVFFCKTPNILSELNSAGYRKAKRKVLLFEIAERGVAQVFSVEQKVQRQFAFDLNIENPILDRIFIPNANNKYSIILERSIFTHKIHSAICTFRFDLFGYIPTSTPVYTLNPPFLFYEPTVSNKPGGFYYNYSDFEMNAILDSIQQLQHTLSEQYNLELILLVVPNKYTIYHHLINNHTYNNFIPELREKLLEKGIRSINILDDFQQSDKLLYYPTDTHWNQDGIALAFQKIIDSI